MPAMLGLAALTLNGCVAVAAGGAAAVVGATAYFTQDGEDEGKENSKAERTYAKVVAERARKLAEAAEAAEAAARQDSPSAPEAPRGGVVTAESLDSSAVAESKPKRIQPKRIEPKVIEPKPVVEVKPEPKPAAEAKPEPKPLVEAKPEPKPAAEAKPAGVVVLRWKTAEEVEVRGFNIWRAESTDGPWVAANSDPISAAGNSASARSYEFSDGKLTAGKVYYYYLEEVLFSGERQKISEVMPYAARPAE